MRGADPEVHAESAQRSSGDSLVFVGGGRGDQEMKDQGRLKQLDHEKEEHLEAVSEEFDRLSLFRCSSRGVKGLNQVFLGTARDPSP